MEKPNHNPYTDLHEASWGMQGVRTNPVQLCKGFAAMISKIQFGEALKNELEKGFDIARLSLWSYGIFFNHNRQLSEELKETLEYLFRMDDVTGQKVEAKNIDWGKEKTG